MSADVAESKLREAHIVAALDSNARGSLKAIGTSCRKIWENAEGSICLEVCGFPGVVVCSRPGDTERSEFLCGRSYGFGRLKSR